MQHFLSYRDAHLFSEGVAVSTLAERYGTPLYVYSKPEISSRCKELRRAFESQGQALIPCYAVKANGNLSILREVFSLGFGADVVSVGEMERALLAGAAPSKIVFSGVGKQRFEIERALDVGILSFNVESLGELKLIGETARERKKQARVSLRVNPNIDAGTHPHIATGLYTTKFGIGEAELPQAAEVIRREPNLQLIGLDCHIGSQITEVEPFKEAALRMVQVAKNLMAEGFSLEMLDLGGGLGIRYSDEVPPVITDYARVVSEIVNPTGLKLVLEPGRWIVGNAGGLLTRVVGIKATPKKNFIIVDAAMNDLIRPSLYDAFHAIVPAVNRGESKTPARYDIVGPICETGDFLAKDRELPTVEVGDLLWIASAGAYASSMASQYNTRPRAAECWVSGDAHKEIRRREVLSDLWEHELEALHEA